MCTTIVVGKNRSANGCCMMAHSEELGRNSAHKVDVTKRASYSQNAKYPLFSGGGILQPLQTARYICTRIFDKNHYPGDHTGGVNEYGVMVSNNMAILKGMPEEDGYAVHPGGVIWTEFSQLVLERAKSALEGIELIGKLCEERGLSCDSATMLAVADYDDAWWIELARDGQWAAKRVQPDEVIMRANCYCIRAIDFGDKENYRYSANIQDYARSRGWYDSGEFDFASIFGDPEWQNEDYNLNRHRVLEPMLAAETRISAESLMKCMREIYRDTVYFREGHRGSPFRTGMRTIARLNTEASIVIELRRELPPDIGNLLWCNMSTSYSGVYVPFHLGISEVEQHYATAGAEFDKKSAYWLFTELSRLTDYGFRDCESLISQCWREFETEAMAENYAAEEELALLPEQKRIRAATKRDRETAEHAIAVLKKLLPNVKTKVFYEDF